jgi:hypothetical protein
LFDLKEANTKMDLDKLRDMILEADKFQLSSFDPDEINKRITSVYQFVENNGVGVTGREISLILYDHNYKMRNIDNIPAFQDLLKYLYDHKVIKTEEFDMYFLDLIFRPLLRQLNRNEIERAVDNKENNQPCTINNIQLLNLVEWQVVWCLNSEKGIRKVNLYSILCGIELKQIDELKIDEIIFSKYIHINAKLRQWSKRERAVFATLHNKEFLWDDFKTPTHQEVFVEIECEYPLKNGFPLDESFKVIDLIKWSLMILAKNPIPVSEGTCIITINEMGSTIRRRRDENPCIPNIIVVKEEMADKIQNLINNFLSVSNKFNDLWDALRFFGRACVSTIERDSLIDSVIGLESLLVFGHGETTYKFSLHGATICSLLWEQSKISLFENEKGLFESKDNLVKWFKDLYGERSDSVHGGNEEINEYAETAVYALAVMIERIIYLQMKDLIDINRLDPNKKVIAGAVEQYVIDKTVFKNID